MVLILEDSPEACRMYQVEAEVLGIPIVIAPNVEKAAALFNEHKSCLKAIVFDGKINGVVVPTCRLVAQIRSEGFTGTMVAASHCSQTNSRLLAAGCDQAISDKSKVFEEVLETLGA